METLNEADERYLRDMAADCVAWLGSGAQLLELRRETIGGAVRLEARFRIGHRECESSGIGPSVVAAHAALRAQILVDRLRLGVVAAIEDPVS